MLREERVCFRHGWKKQDSWRCEHGVVSHQGWLTPAPCVSGVGCPACSSPNRADFRSMGALPGMKNLLGL